MARGLTVEVHRLPLHAATDIYRFDILTWANATTAEEGRRPVVPVATTGVEVVGVTDEARFGGLHQPVRCLVAPNIARAVAAATVLFGENVGFGTFASAIQVNGTGASKVTQLKPVAAASGSVVWRAGVAQEAANPGEVFSFYVAPEPLSGRA